MNKIIRKLLILIGIILLLQWIPAHSPLGSLILKIIFVLVAVVLLVILSVLIQSLKIFQRPQNGYRVIDYKGIQVRYAWALNGGGIIFSDDFVRIVRNNIGHVDHIFEYCSGPGFIGFNLLANGLCNRLTLSDVNPEAVKAMNETIKNNHLEDRVNVYLSDCLDSIPDNERWDLVVGNPPWDLNSKRKDIRVIDSQGQVHRKFFQDIRKFLKPDGSVLFVEGGEYTKPNAFTSMIEGNGLKIAEVLKYPSLKEMLKNLQADGLSKIIFSYLYLAAREVYFLWIKPK